jgi:hypothetical protein
MTQPQAPSGLDASNSALDAYNTAVAYVANAQSQLDGMPQRPDDIQEKNADGTLKLDSTGKPLESGAGKQWDADHSAYVKALEDAKAQASQASLAYSQILSKQAAADAASNTPEALATAERNRQQAAYYQARGEGYAAHTAAQEHAAQTRADAAMQRADAAGGRVGSQNNLSDAQAETQRATAANITARTPAEVAQATAAANASNAAAAKSAKETANLQSPQQAQADRLAQIAATAHAQADAAVQQLQQEVDSGLKLPEAAAKELDAKLKEVAADAQSQRDQALKQFEFNLNQPNLDANRAISQQTANATSQNAATSAATAEANRVYQQQQTDLAQRKDQLDVLGKQATQGQGLLDQSLKAGVAPSSVLTGLAFNPLRQALQLSRQAVSSGMAPSSAIPQPSAPAPAAAAPAQPTAPAPAYPVAA